MASFDLTIKIEHILTSLTIIVAILVVFVAYLQFKLANEKLKLDLFEKRFAIYKGVQSFLTYIMTEGKLTNLDKLSQFRAETQNKVFLFKDDIVSYLKEIDQKALGLLTIGEEIRDMPKGEQRSNLIKTKSELLRWLISQLPELIGIFSPYLKFKTWK